MPAGKAASKGYTLPAHIGATLYKTKTAQHYFCKVCGIHTHNRPRINPKIFGINVACVEGINPFELDNVGLNDGENHPLDQKK